MNQLRFHSGARAEFRESVLFYEGELPGLGAEFVAEVEHTIEFIVTHPNAGSRCGATSAARSCVASLLQ